MTRPAVFALLAFAACGRVLAAENDIVFRSDVSLVRVDAQVVDRGNRTITGLRAEDFVLREEGRPQEIRNFTSENMPVDVVLLLDVSGSMRPHVERVASAAHQALQVLGKDDRVAIMVFDRSTRLRLPFRNSRQDVERGLEAMLNQETFDGGTDITRGLLDAANYLAREGRREARRAIVILTDDQTERDRNEAAVSRALTNADAVLSLLLAPDAMQQRRQFPGRSGGGWPGGNSGGPLGGIIFGRRGPYGGGPGSSGPVMTRSRTQSAGTAEIARQSGGDSLQVDDASALETTLARIRQRYALHFYLPAGVKPGQERSIEVELAQAARTRYPGAEVRFRRVYLSPGGSADPVGGSSEPVVVSDEHPRLKRRPAVNEPDGSRGAVILEPQPQAPAETKGGWRRADEATEEPHHPKAADAPADEAPKQGGWRRLKPGEQP